MSWVRDAGLFFFALAPMATWAAGGSLSFGPGSFDLNSCPALETDFSGRLTLKARWDIETTPLAERSLPGFAYDEIRRLAVVFGGVGAQGQALGDTWVWSSTSGWRNVSPATAPVARYGHALAWAGSQFILAGGSSDQETWSYDVALNSWSRLATINAPPANLFSPAMVYVGASSRVVLTGGGQGGGMWVYDLPASSWSFYNPSAAPQDRRGAAMTYDRVLNKAVLFGGQSALTGAYLQDTWLFDAQNFSWSQLSVSSAPPSRAFAAMSYDPELQAALLFGGRNEGNLGDFYFLEADAARWRQFFSSNNDVPPGRFGSGMAYDPSRGRTMLFAGQRDNQVVGSLWTFLWRSSGSCVSSSQSVSGTTALAWGAVNASVGAKPMGSETLIQLAVSSDGVNFDAFRGPGGGTQSYYDPLGASTAIWPQAMNTRYLKMKTLLRASNPADRSTVNSFDVSYNRAPSIPVLLSPSSGTRLNRTSVTFEWQVAADPDGLGDIPLSYNIEISTGVDFSSATFAGSGLADAQNIFAIAEGLWYWRVRAKDKAGLLGDWSHVFVLSIDTRTPPAPVTELGVDKSTGNHSLLVFWAFPGDDKGAVSGGRYRIRYSSSGLISSEALWEAALEQSGLFSAASGQAMTTSLLGLEDRTTYYLAIKTEDELGNLSGLSMSSPYAMTNASPTVALSAPVGGEILVGVTTITWFSDDANASDALYVSLRLTKESQASYEVMIASGLSRSATSYFWDSRLVPNATDYRVIITALDASGYSFWAASPGLIRFDNVNEAPVVTIVTGPASGQKIEGDLTVVWSVRDPNAFDTHLFNVYLSIDGGASIAAVAAYDLTATSVTLDSLSFETRWGFDNLSTYQIKVVATDSGRPPLTGSAATPVFEAVVKPDQSIRLTRPLNDDYPSLFDLVFEWKAPSGLSPPVGYTVFYGTQASLGGEARRSSVTGLTLTPSASLFRSSTAYYWQVHARDSLGREQRSQVKKFLFSRSHSKSKDGKLAVRISSGLSDGAYLAFQNASDVMPQVLETARSWALADRYYEVMGETAWQVKLKDESGRELSSDNVSAWVTLGFSDVNGDSKPDGFLAAPEHLRVARLNESRNRWEIVPGAQEFDSSGKTVSAQVSGFSVFTLAATAGFAEALSGVTSYPNPFDPARGPAKIRYTLTQDSKVTIRIYTLSGDLVRVLEFDAGASGGQGSSAGSSNEVAWDGRNGTGAVVANGVYLAEIEAESSQGKSGKIRRIGVVK
ncbi:MAG: hypothetical protein HY547_01630 [Elusimicrobia bacterium]|nr:hypothetical protein [Elusimicrobiota bacterium]